MGGGSGLSVETGEVNVDVTSTPRFNITTKLSKITHYAIIKIYDTGSSDWPIVAVVDGRVCVQGYYDLGFYSNDKVTTSLSDGNFTVEVNLTNFRRPGKYYYALFGE